ncbi:J domain-containing protein [Weeksellaceae bacterium KMM 9724]|uniref:J domain-containing protein n=1 Tax=Profundicola chukchiensis TaxID=2961959 RepID=UPI00243B7336|nr:J domain-containing protein [Profundicola chukchiensis]MDG4951066.1 J domain-containing protein [Profundicola chukchiensis]
MTNYYNILGLESDADISEIKTNYRKLSKKFHPDLNPNDDFFGKMFLQIQEAYEVLSDEETRRRYDQKLKTNYSPYSNKPTHQPMNDYMPVIENFSVDKDSVARLEEFTVTWKVKNADFIQIRPLGIFKEEGFEKFKFSKLKGRSVNLVLIATNTDTGLSVRKHIEIYNKRWRPRISENENIMDAIILILRILMIAIVVIFILMMIFMGVRVVEPVQP